MKFELVRRKKQLGVNEERVDKEEHKSKKVKLGLEKANHCLETIKSQLKQA